MGELRKDYVPGRNFSSCTVGTGPQNPVQCYSQGRGDAKSVVTRTVLSAWGQGYSFMHWFSKHILSAYVDQAQGAEGRLCPLLSHSGGETEQYTDHHKAKCLEQGTIATQSSMWLWAQPAFWVTWHWKRDLLIWDLHYYTHLSLFKFLGNCVFSNPG